MYSYVRDNIFRQEYGANLYPSYPITLIRHTALAIWDELHPVDIWPDIDWSPNNGRVYYEGDISAIADHVYDIFNRIWPLVGQRLADDWPL